MEIRRLHDPNNVALISLVKQSDVYLESLYPPESNHAQPIAALMTDDAAFFGAYVDNVLAACGGVKFCDDDVRYGEIKRVFVDSHFRGQGLAVGVMSAIEQCVSAHGVQWVRLEAGPLQPAALRLYAKLGYQRRGPFGGYTHDPLSVYMEKHLA
ncbi:MAG: GNAT family N-acetyltransferase [Pseudomonadota bacterium]